MQIMQLLRFFYHKGLRDGCVNSSHETQEILDRDDFINSFQVLFDFNGKVVSLNEFHILISRCAAECNLRVLDFVLDHLPENAHLKGGIVYLCDLYYRRGLADGGCHDIYDVEQFIYKNKDNYRLLSKKFVSYIDSVKFAKSEAMYICAFKDKRNKPCSAVVSLITNWIKAKKDLLYQ